MNNLIPLAAAVSAGIAGGCIAWLVITLLQDVRIDKDSVRVETARKLPVYFRFLLLFASNMTRFADHPSLEDMRQKVTEQLAMAGLSHALTASQFLSIRFLSVLCGVLLCLLLNLQGQALPGILAFGLLAVYPGTWLRSAISKRHTQILKALPNLLDLLTLSVEAGKDFLTALGDILVKRKPDALGDEFARTIQEIQLGKKRQTAFKEMGNRIRQPELSSVLNSIVQADEMGVSIGQILRIQSDQMRAKRFAMAEKLANEAPVKILFPVVVFIFPSVFLMLMGPVVLRMFRMIG